MPTRSQIVNYVRSLIGTAEYPPGSNRNKITEAYGQHAPWCAMTTWYVYKHFGVDLRKEFTPMWAATTYGANEAKAKGLWRNGISGVKPGDLVYFKVPDGAPGWVNHTGIAVEKVPGGVRTIEGNTANVCAERVRLAYIVGYIDMTPYVTNPPTPQPAPPPFPGRAAFRIGRTHSAVTQLDRQLIRLGYTRKHDGDGYQAGPRFTKWTRENVKAFQTAQGWTGADADGYPGPETWRRLFTAPTPKR
ncbi:peptidoglycan-binding protein [Streptomyces sp. ISL-100]|uniref:peptidoglycan-binding protein n=1 Tax=Streptomyces sp. ISL-100 TaxID=2819173 RepID=UPI001BE9552F|nr:peptidoglycan-binding protein [Streptomyces sp. ISL-100]MBT2400648.1 peptidoglycan-binding protein [Streptomyces sp. ISL-100]